MKHRGGGGWDDGSLILAGAVVIGLLIALWLISL